MDKTDMKVQIEKYVTFTHFIKFSEAVFSSLFKFGMLILSQPAM